MCRCTSKLGTLRDGYVGNGGPHPTSRCCEVGSTDQTRANTRRTGGFGEGDAESFCPPSPPHLFFKKKNIFSFPFPSVYGSWNWKGEVVWGHSVLKLRLEVST